MVECADEQVCLSYDIAADANIEIPPEEEGGLTISQKGRDHFYRQVGTGRDRLGRDHFYRQPTGKDR